MIFHVAKHMTTDGQPTFLDSWLNLDLIMTYLSYAYKHHSTAVKNLYVRVENIKKRGICVGKRINLSY